MYASIESKLFSLTRNRSTSYCSYPFYSTDTQFRDARKSLNTVRTCSGSQRRRDTVQSVKKLRLLSQGVARCLGFFTCAREEILYVDIGRRFQFVGCASACVRSSPGICKLKDVCRISTADTLYTSIYLHNNFARGLIGNRSPFSLHYCTLCCQRSLVLRLILVGSGNRCSRL